MRGCLSSRLGIFFEREFDIILDFVIVREGQMNLSGMEGFLFCGFSFLHPYWLKSDKIDQFLPKLSNPS
jgi:hypothetical protein